MNRYSVLDAQLNSFILYCLEREFERPFKFCKSSYFCYKNFPYDEKMFLVEKEGDFPEDLLEGEL